VQHLLGLRPALGFLVEEATTDRLLEAVASRRLDCAICRFTSASPDSGLVQQHLYSQEPRLVVSRASARRLARRGIDWDAFASLKWILPPQHSPIRNMIHSIFASAGQQVPAPVLEAYAQKTVSSVLRQLPDAITILPDGHCAGGGRGQRRQCPAAAPAVELATRGNRAAVDLSNAHLVAGIAKALRAGPVT
jgi:DNA-binding transcriptional LysR family regulator